jgi:TolB-like protein
VAPFQGNTVAHEKGLDRSVSEWIATGLVQSQRYRVMERAQVKSLINERVWAATDFGDPDSIKKFGKMLGVDYMVLGTATRLGRLLRVDARLVSTRDAQVVAAEQALCDQAEYYHNLVNRIVNKLTAGVPTPGATAGQ